MYRWKKALTITALLLCTVFALSACSASPAKDRVRMYVTGNIDSVYLGQHDPDYLSSVDMTKEEAQAYYLEMLNNEAEFFCYYWDITPEEDSITYDDIDEELKSELVSLYHEICAHTKYEVINVKQTGAGSYIVKLKIYPIDIMEQANTLYDNYEYEPLNDLISENLETFDTMSDAERLAFFNEYGKTLAAMVRELLPDIGYCEPVTLSLHVAPTEEYSLSTDEDDWNDIGNYFISYP